MATNPKTIANTPAASSPAGKTWSHRGTSVPAIGVSSKSSA